MSSTITPNINSLRAGAAVAKGQPVKLSSGNVIPVAAATDRAIGIAQNAAAPGGLVEIAHPGGGGFGLAGASISAGNLLGFNTDGELVKVANASDIVIAQALEDASENDIFSVQVIGPFQATATQA